MAIVLLGANSKLGSMLRFWANRTGANWLGQTRDGSGDLRWSGSFDDPSSGTVLREGSTVINMIGATSGDPATLNRLNVTFVQDLLHHAARNKVAHVVLASSAAVYGGHGSGVFAENSPLSSASPYGTSKIAMENAALTMGEIPGGPKITILRIGNVAGADALNTAAQRYVDTGTPMHLHRFADGSSPIRSYIGPHDLFRAVRALTNPPQNAVRVVNLAHPQPVTLADLAAAYRSHLFPSLAWTDTPAPDTALQRVELDTTKLATQVNFMPFDDPAESFAGQVADYVQGQGQT